MRNLFYILWMLLPVCLCTCQRNTDSPLALQQAEAWMNEHPDSALSVLNAISPDEMGKNSTRSLYALLYTQAQDKNYIHATG